MSQSHAPYRADEVGSLLRTAPLKEARAKREKGEITPAQLKAVEDEEIRKIISEAGGGRPAARHRRRVPPLLVALRFLLASDGLRARQRRRRASSSMACRPRPRA